jgi:tetratricopeptide (TPR) repeat protein
VKPGAWLGVAAALALALTGLLWLRGPVAPAFDLPSYGAELEGEVRTQRSPEAGGGTAEGGPPTFRLGGPFRLLLRPEHEVAADPQFAFFLVEGVGEETGGWLEPWDVGYTRSADGVIEIEGTLGEDLSIAPGSWTFVFLYGRPGGLPRPATLADLAAGADDWAVVRVPFRVVPDLVAGELPLEVLYAGCYSVRRGPICVPYGELTFWIRSLPEAEIGVQVAGQPAGAQGTAVDGGRRFTVPVTAADGEVEILAAAGGRETRFHLALAGNDEPRWLWSARRRALAGETEAARQELEAGLAEAPPAVRGPVLSLLGRVLDQLGENEEEIAARLEEAVELHRENGRLLALADDLAMLQSFDVRHRRFDRLRRRLDTLAESLPPEAPAEAVFHLDYYRGIFAGDVGNYRAALAALESAADLARRLDLPRERARAEAKMGQVLHNLGRGAEAEVLFETLEAVALPPCEQVRVHNNHAWVRILAGGDLGDPLPLLEQALRLAEREGCSEDLWLDLRLNRALAFVEQGRGWEARQALAAAREMEDSATALHRLWWEDAEGRLALAEGRGGDALEHYRRMEAWADGAFDARGLWRAKVRQAAALELVGETDAALAAFGEAEALLDDQSVLVPLDAGRESFVADRDAATRQHLALLVRAGRTAEAFEVARRSRTRVLRGVYRGHRLAHLAPAEQAVWDLAISHYLEMRDAIDADAAEDWRLSAARRTEARARREELRREARRALDRAFQVLGEEGTPAPLPAPRDGELILAYHPLPEGWVGFAARRGRIDTHRFVLPPETLEDPNALSRLLLEPFGGAIAAASRIRVLASGELRQVDFHALPWGGDALLAARPVAYGLDLGPERAAPAARAGGRGRALVVGDPRGDLPAARHEAAVVETVLRRGGFTEVLRLEGPEATLPALRRRLAGVDLLHVAGHGAAAGRFGWESALYLAAGGRLTLGDVLALERAPAQVVLSSCESARDAGTPVAGLGLAQAFLVAGSERVIAALRPVGDRDTEALFARLYASPGASTHLAAHLREAQLAWRASDPAADWASFRVLEP